MMSNEQFEQLMNKLDILIKITAANAFQGKSMTESISFLADLGFGNTEIANILGTTPAYVNKVKYESKKEKGTRKRKDTAEEETTSQVPSDQNPSEQNRPTDILETK